MVQQENKLFLTLGKNLIERNSCQFLIANCPNCGCHFDVGKGHYQQYLATYCPHCNAFIHYNK